MWVKIIQKAYFDDVLTFLENLDSNETSSVAGKVIIKSKKLQIPDICKSLQLVLDTEGVIRIKTSLCNATNLSYSQRFPILIPRASKLAELIIINSHEKCGHFGMNYTRAHVRNKFWIPKSTYLIKKLVTSCSLCKFERGKAYHLAKSPPLPDYRSRVDQVFQYVALDMTGHIFYQ